MARFIFLDLETTGLEAGKDQITEAAWILENGTERQYIVQHDRLPNEWVLKNTDYLTRIAPSAKTPLDTVLRDLTADCIRLSHDGIASHTETKTTPLGSFNITVRDADPQRVYLVGACPAFDDRFLRIAFGEANVPYHYHVLDIEAMALGVTRAPEPGSLKDLRSWLSIEGENEAAHTALADAREVKLIFNALRSHIPVSP